MKSVFKKIIAFVGIIITLTIMSTIGYSILTTSADSENMKIAEHTEKSNDLVIDSRDETIGKHSGLSMEKLQELYDKGYGVLDIETAYELSGIYDMDIEKILEIKGLPDYKQETGNVGFLNDGSRTWGDVRGELNIRKSMKENGAGEKEVNRTVSDFRKQMAEKNRLTDKSSQEKLSDRKIDLEKITIITEEDIEKCKQNNIYKREDIARAKKIALKYKVSLDKVLLEIKEGQADWTKVIKALGGEVNE
jgi:hypothetical protein